MREIKFDIVARNIHFNEVKHTVYTLEELWQGNLATWLKSSNCEMIAKREWTGLKDKNGIEVYEGDIVEYLDGEFSFAAIVEWGDYGWYMKGIDPDDNFSFDDIDSDVTVVIGDIYENPELLAAPPQPEKEKL